jgi:hypothetical protein
VKNCYLAEGANGSHVANAITNHTAIAVSDGSQKASMGTSAYVLEGLTSTGRIIGVNIAPGNIAFGDSQCCELAGIYAIVLLDNLLCETHSISYGSITVGCDNLSSMQKYFDLVSAIQWKIQHSPIKWYGHHVYRHQDNLGRPLNWWETLNV